VIDLPNGWLAKELNMNTHTQFSNNELAQVLYLKDKASEVIKTNIPHMKEIFLAGGCFKSFAHAETAKDFDIFLTTESAKNVINNHTKFDDSLSLERYIINTDPSYWGNEMIEKTILDTQTKVQYIFTKYKTRREVIDHFDMLHTCVSYVPDEDKLYISKATLDAINERKIIPNGKNKILDWRIRKMQSQGWSVV
jgi:hypothetical protein